MAVYYQDGGRTTEEPILSGAVRVEDIPYNVEIYPELGEWAFMPGTDLEERYNIGSGVRVPEGTGYWGIMMIYDDSNSQHRSNVAMNKRDLASGQLAA